MSANMEKSESLPRVATRSMRRMNSSESLNQDNERPETPTGRLRATKKLESIDETAITPTRRSTRAGSVQKTIIAESTTPASPLRRVTRRMSNDNAEVVPSPRLGSKRAPKQRTVTESDDDEVIFVNEMLVTPRTKASVKRLSVNVVKLENVVEEEQPEIEAIDEKPENDKSNELNKSADLNKSSELDKSSEHNKSGELHDLELRNRSISKSPLVIQRTSISSNDNSNSVQEISNDSVGNGDNSTYNNVSEVKSVSPTKSPKKKTSETNLSSQITPIITINKEKSVSPSKSPKKKSSSEKITNGSASNTQPQPDTENDSLTRRRSSRKSIASLTATISDDIGPSVSQTSSIESQKSGLSQNNFDSYRKNIIEPFNSNNESDLAASDSECSNLVIQLSKSPEKSSQGSDNCVTKERDNPDKEYEDSNEGSEFLPLQRVYDIPEYYENKKVQNKSIESIPTENEPSKVTEIDKEQSLISKDSGITSKGDETANDKENDDVVSEMMEDFVPTQKPAENVLKKTPSLLFNKTQMNTVDMDIGSDEEQSTLDETNKQNVDMEITTFVTNKQSPVKNSKSSTWNQSVTGSASQIDTLKEPEPEVIHETSIKKKKAISSDESEDESENKKNSFIDDEAEVASDEEESMTKSERDYLEQNEVIEDGESLGSQDSNEFDEDEDDYDEEDSFIDKDEDIDERYSMDSDDKLLEEEEELNKSKSKRKSRIIVQSSSESEDETPKSTQKSPAKPKEPEVSPAKPNEPEVSPVKSQSRKSLPNMDKTENAEKLDKKTRKSMSNLNDSIESSPKALDKSAKKRRKSNIQEEAEKALSDAEKALSDVEKALSDVEMLSPIKLRRNKKGNVSMTESVADKLLSDAEKAISDAEKAVSDAENAERVLLSLKKSAKKNRKSNVQNEEEVIQETPKLDKKGRKSLPNIEESEKVEKSNKKLRKTLSNLDDENIQTQSPLKALEKSAKKSRNSNVQQDIQEPSETIQSPPKSAKKNSKLQASPKSDLSSSQDSSLNRSDTTAKESSQEELNIGKKRKRNDSDENSNTKRFRKMSANESEALHMDNYLDLVSKGHSSSSEEDVGNNKQQSSTKVVEKIKKNLMEPINDDEMDEPMEVDEVPVKKVKKVKKTKEVDFNAILNRCNEYMEQTKEEKKAKMALKKERKAKKLEKKMREKEAAGSTTEEKLDSSTGENKENAEKIKKKKNKKKKPKLVEEIDNGKKEEINERLEKLQQKLELKRQRKKEKKLAKLLAEQATEPEKSEKVVEKKNEKPQKVVEHEAGPSKASNKKEKVIKIETKPVENVEVEKAKKKSKKQKLVENVEEEVPVAVKIKKSKKHAEPEPEVPTQHESVPKHEKQKAKKRPISETVDENDMEVVEKPKAKKKLNILKDVENSSHAHASKKSHNKNVETVKPTSTLMTSKLNKIIPKGLGTEVKHVTKKKPKVVEDKKFLKRPVWTTAGMFIEEPVTPYKFKSTEYKTVNFGSNAASKAKVVIFSAQNSSKSAVVDHKMQAIMKKNKNRDKSIKNLKNLM